MATDGIKIEEDIKVKPDPELAGASPFPDDDDQYEDTGELTLPKDSPKIWLTRIPNWLWQVLQNASEDEQVQIGEMLVYGADKPDSKLKFKLKDDWAEKRKVPKEYHLKITSLESINTWVFSEKDLPGYKPGNRIKAEAHSTGQQDTRSGSGFRVEKRRHRFRRAIPKHTALVGPKLDHEVECVPVQNKEYRDFMDEYNRVVIRANTKLDIIPDHVVISGMGNLTNAAKFQNFTTKDLPAPRSRAQENKASRIPEKDLIDILYKLFKEFKYWRLKDLRQRTRQPEIYLKQVLSQIAILISSGDFTGTWTLKPENQHLYEGFDMNNEVAPEMVGVSVTAVEMMAEDGADDDDDNDEMVDVL